MTDVQALARFVASADYDQLSDKALQQTTDSPRGSRRRCPPT
ncbi:MULTISPECIES: hypothetical protein [Gordonia]|jgi:hypothetical protein|nr:MULTISPECIES: hypothetical protein [Gordonia]